MRFVLLVSRFGAGVCCGGPGGDRGPVRGRLGCCWSWVRRVRRGRVFGLPAIPAPRGVEAPGSRVGRRPVASAMRSTLEAGGAPPEAAAHPRPTTPQPGVSGRGGGGVPERGRGFRHCQAHIRVSSSQVGCSQDGAPHLRRALGGSKHSRGSFLPRRAFRYTTGLGQDAGCAHGGVSWSSPPTQSRPAPEQRPPQPSPVACRAESFSCIWRAAAAGPSTTWPGCARWHRPGGGIA